MNNETHVGKNLIVLEPITPKTEWTKSLSLRRSVLLVARYATNDHSPCRGVLWLLWDGFVLVCKYHFNRLSISFSILVLSISEFSANWINCSMISIIFPDTDSWDGECLLNRVVSLVLYLQMVNSIPSRIIILDCLFLAIMIALSKRRISLLPIFLFNSIVLQHRRMLL